MNAVAPTNRNTCGYAVPGASARPAMYPANTPTTTIKGTVDGLIYALLTAGTFGWLWPR